MRGGASRMCRLLNSLYRVGLDKVPCDGAGAEATQGRQITPHGRTFGAGLHPVAGIVRQPSTADFIEIEGAERGMQLSEAGAVSLLRCRFQRRQIVIGEAFQSFLVGAARPSTTVEAMMLIEKLGEELLGGGFGGGVGGSPDLPAVVLETNPVLELRL